MHTVIRIPHSPQTTQQTKSFVVFIGATLTTNMRQRKHLRTLRNAANHDVLHKCIVVNFAFSMSLHR